MAADVTAKRNDTRPTLAVTLTQGSPASAINLTTATSVKLYLRKAVDQGAVFLTRTGAITDATNGVVTFTFQTGDLATADTYLAEFEITWSDGGIETVPNNGYKSLQIVPDLGP